MATLVTVVAAVGSELTGAQALRAVPPPAAPSPNICLPEVGSLGWCGDGDLATRAQLARPSDVAIAPDGTLIVADTQNQVIRSIDPAGRIATIAGVGLRGDARAVVSARRARFRNPSGVAVDADGAVVVADTGNNAIRRIEPSGRVVTIVGSGLSSPTDVVALPGGGYAVADSGHDRVVHVSADGAVVSPLAGSGVEGYSGDGGPAPFAQLDRPIALAHSDGGLLIAENGNGILRRVAPDGTIATMAGKPPGVGAGATPASRIVFESLGGVAPVAGGFLVSDTNRVWRVGEDGSLEPFAGTALAGYNGDTGIAVALRLDRPAQLVAAGDATLVVDRGNDRIRRVAVDGSELTLAGSGDPNARVVRTPAAPFRSLPPRIRRRARRPQSRFRLSPGAVPHRQRGRDYISGGGGDGGGGGGGGGSGVPACAKGTVTSNRLKIQPYGDSKLQSAAKPVDIDFALSRDAPTFTAYAWRNFVRYGIRSKSQSASTGTTIRLRGRLRKQAYYAVVVARTDTGERLCDARKLVVK